MQVQEGTPIEQKSISEEESHGNKILRKHAFHTLIPKMGSGQRHLGAGQKGSLRTTFEQGPEELPTIRPGEI